MEQENVDHQHVKSSMKEYSINVEDYKDSMFEENFNKLPEPEIINFVTQDLEKEIQILKQNGDQSNNQTKKEQENDIKQEEQKNQTNMEESMSSFMSSLPRLVGMNNQHKDQRNLIDQHWLLNSQQQNESVWQSSVNSLMSIGQSKIGNGGILNKFTQSLVQNQQNVGNVQLKDFTNNLMNQQSLFQDSGQFDQYINMFAQANQQYQTGNKLTSKNSFKHDISQNNSQLTLEDMMNQKVRNTMNNLGLDVINEIQSIKNPMGANNILTDVSRFSQDANSEAFVIKKDQQQHASSQFKNFNKNDNINTAVSLSNSIVDSKVNDQILSSNSNLKVSNISQLPSLKNLTNSIKSGQNSQKNVQKQKLFSFFDQVPKIIYEKIDQKNQLFKEKILERQTSLGSQFRNIFQKLINKNNQQKESSQRQISISQSLKKQDGIYSSNNNNLNKQSGKNINKVQDQKQVQLPPITIKQINTTNTLNVPAQSQALTQTLSAGSIKQQKKDNAGIQATTVVSSSQKLNDLQQEQVKTNNQQNEALVVKVNYHQKSGQNNSSDYQDQNNNAQIKVLYNQNKNKSQQEVVDQLINQNSHMNTQSEGRQNSQKQAALNVSSNRLRSSFNLEFQQGECQKESTQNYQLFLKNQENEEFNLYETQIDPNLFNPNISKQKYRSNTQSKNRSKTHLPELMNSKYYSLAQEKRAEKKVNNGYPFEQTNTKKQTIKIRVNKQDNTSTIQNSTIMSNLNNSQSAMKRVYLDQNNYKLENLLSEHIHLKEFDDSAMQEFNSYSHLRFNKFANQNLLIGVQNQRNQYHQSISPHLNTSKKLSPQPNNKSFKIMNQSKLGEDYPKNQGQNPNINFLQGKDITLKQESSKKTKKRKIVKSLQIPIQFQQLQQQSQQQSFYYSQQQSQHSSQFQNQYIKQNNIGHSQLRSMSNQQQDISQNQIGNSSTYISQPGIFMVKKANLYNR